MKYFKNLDADWADIEIKNFKGRVSNMLNVPWNILRAYEEYIIYGHCIIPFDEEGSDFNIYIDDVSVIILKYKDDYEIFEVGENPSMFIRDIAFDIADNLKEWVKWYNANDNINDGLDFKQLELVCIKLGLLKTKVINFMGRGV